MNELKGIIVQQNSTAEHGSETMLKFLNLASLKPINIDELIPLTVNDFTVTWINPM